VSGSLSCSRSARCRSLPIFRPTAIYSAIGPSSPRRVFDRTGIFRRSRSAFAVWLRSITTTYQLSTSAYGRGGGVGRARRVGRGLGVTLGVVVGLTLGEGVVVGVAEGLGVTVGVGVTGGVAVGVGVTGGVAVGVGVGVTGGVAVGVTVGVGVGVGDPPGMLNL
jgi:hypothetical protein